MSLPIEARAATGARRLRSETYAEAPIRQIVEWSPGQRRAAMALADAGNLRLAADLTEAAMADDRVIGCLAARTRGLTGLTLEFEEGAGKARKRKRAVKALEAEEDFWAIFPEAELVQLLSWAIVLGIGLAELVWEKQGERVLPKIKVWHPRWLRFDWQTREWKLTVADGTEIVVTPGDGKWILLTPYGCGRPWAMAPWRAVALAWIAKYYDLQDWAHHNEVHGSPILVGETPDGTQESDVDGFGADLASVNGRTTMALPPGYKITLTEATSQSFTTFKEQIDWADKAIAIALLGQNLTTDVSSGSLAAASIHNQVRGDFIRADAESLATALHDQVLTWWARFNFGDPDAAPWPSWDTSPPEDKKARADTLLTLANALNAFKTAGVDVDLEEIGQAFDIELTEAEAPAVTPDGTQPVGGDATAANDQAAADATGADAEDAADEVEAAPPGVDDE